MPPLQCFLGVSKTVRQTPIYLPSRISLGIDFFGICAKVWMKAVMETRGPVRSSEREPFGGRLPDACRVRTAPEPYVRKCHAGCARYRVNE